MIAVDSDATCGPIGTSVPTDSDAGDPTTAIACGIVGTDD